MAQHDKLDCKRWLINPFSWLDIPFLEVKQFKCPQCVKSFNRNDNLTKHLNFVHYGKKNFTCPFGDTKQKWPALLATLCYGNPQCIGCMWSLVIYALSFCPDKTFVQEVLSKTKLKLSGTNILSKVKKTVFSCQNTFKMNFSSWIWVWGF